MVISRKQNYKKNNKRSLKKILKGGYPYPTINGRKLEPYTIFPEEFDFRGHSLIGVNLSGCSLIKANFKGVNLTNANFSNANLTEANFEKATLFNAN